jgi:hypothetical protein
MLARTHLHIVVLTCCLWTQKFRAALASADNIFADPYLRTGTDVEGTTESASSSSGTTSSFSSLSSCSGDLEALVENEDLRTELSAINLHYLENGSIQRACRRDGNSLDCKLDFRLYPSNLREVCEKHGGSYWEKEHSLQCQNSDTDENLYYQLDHVPSCFAASCGETDAKKITSSQVDGVRRALEENSGMLCLSDWEILEHAGESDGSAGSRQYYHAVSLLGCSFLGWSVLLRHSF